MINHLPKPFKDFTENLDAYDEFLSAWQRIAVGSKKQQVLNDDFYDIEKFAVNALSRLVDETDSASTYPTSPLFEKFQNSALICQEDGLVISSNTQAAKNHAITSGMLLSHLDIRLVNGEALDQHFKSVWKQPMSSPLSLLQCCYKDDAAVFPIAIIQLNKQEFTAPMALLIFLDSGCNSESMALFAIKFGLTKAESDIVSAFSQGISLKEIATSRSRSYTTIRNQFQSILEKTGCPNQSDLLRMLLGVSYLFSLTEMIAPKEQRTIGRKVQVMRPHGRFVDVNLYGKPDGKPFIVLPSLFGMPVTREIEAELKARSLLMIGIWRPGFSETTKPHENDSLYQCLADDVVAVLDSIEIRQCPLLGRASAARAVFNLASLIPERISSACVVNSLVPLPYISRNKILSKWTRSLISAIQFTPALATLILETGRRLMFREGAKQFAEKMYKNSRSDLSAITREGVAESLHSGVDSCAFQGFEAPVEDMLDGFTDWSDDVRRSKLKITLLQGTDDPNVSIKASRDFAKDFPDKVELVEFEDGGGLLNFSHTNEILNWVTNKKPLSHKLL